MRREIAKIRSFEAEQAQAHKTTIFSGVSMIDPSPTAHPHPRCFASAPSPSPEGASYIHPRLYFFINLRFFKSRLITIRLFGSKHDNFPHPLPLAVACRYLSPALARLCQLALWRTPFAKTCHRHLFATLTQQGEPKTEAPQLRCFYFWLFSFVLEA